jgi:Xaa-Pro dipeptidase
MALSSEQLFDRCERLSKRLAQGGFHGLVAGPSANFQYFTGLTLWRSERLIAAVFRPNERPVILCPAFEAARIAQTPLEADVRGWEEDEDPYALCAGLFPKEARIAVEEKTPFFEFDRLREAMPGADFLTASPLTRPLRRKKTDWEAECIRRACRATVARIGEFAGCLTPGITEREARDQFEVGGLVQFGPTSAMPHGDAGDVVLREKDVVLVDTFDLCEGYHSDITRMIFLGPLEPEMVKVYAIVKRASEAAVAALAPGVGAKDIDQAARAVIESEGYGPHFLHRVGHGLGLEIHEPPWLRGDNTDPLAQGDVITIEPGIYLPGRWGIRIEDDLRITEDGAQFLSEPETEMTVLS